MNLPIEKALRLHRSVMAQMPTGTGKTVLRHMPVVATCLNVFSVILSVCGRAKVSVLILWHVFRMGMFRLVVSPNRLAEDLKYKQEVITI